MPRFTANVKTVGADASATGSGRLKSAVSGVGDKVTGWLEEINYKFLVDADTADLTIYVKRNGSNVNLLARTNTDGAGANVQFSPTQAIHTNAGVAVPVGNDGAVAPSGAVNGVKPIYLDNEYVYYTVAQSDAGDPSLYIELLVSQ